MSKVKGGKTKKDLLPTQILPFLYLGNCKNACDLEVLNELGYVCAITNSSCFTCSVPYIRFCSITYILNVAHECDSQPPTGIRCQRSSVQCACGMLLFEVLNFFDQTANVNAGKLFNHTITSVNTGHAHIQYRKVIIDDDEVLGGRNHDFQQIDDLHAYIGTQVIFFW